MFDQTSANRGPVSTFVDKASSTRSSPKPSSGRVIKILTLSLISLFILGNKIGLKEISRAKY